MTSISLGSTRSAARAGTAAAATTVRAANVDAGLAVLRLVTGGVFMAHGAQKLFIFGVDGVSAGFAQMGVPLSGIVGPLVATGELLGGLALVLGLLTRAAGAGLAFIMIGAIFTVHLAAGFFLPNGYEFVLTLFAAAAALALTGPGRYSVDRLIARSKEG
jgi:putative oxidoreductase